jgi:hypothetical protein
MVCFTFNILDMIMQIENTWGNSFHNLRKYFAYIVTTFGSVSKLGQRRFLQLHTICHPNIGKIQALTDILSANSQRFIFIN